ncbi:hypothetical protein F5Y17DRAFT_445448 [Xylariaceae sp. FL0594]|nr:hypothetical protein F5Y17DRAFT_445448 [Xylariaceae sp. FL0594]
MSMIKATYSSPHSTSHTKAGITKFDTRYVVRARPSLSDRIEQWVKGEHADMYFRAEHYLKYSRWCALCIMHAILQDIYAKEYDRMPCLEPTEPGVTDFESSLLFELIQSSPPQGLFETSCPATDGECAHRGASSSPFAKALLVGLGEHATYMIDQCLNYFISNLANDPRRQLSRLLNANRAFALSAECYLVYSAGSHGFDPLEKLLELDQAGYEDGVRFVREEDLLWAIETTDQEASPEDSQHFRIAMEIMKRRPDLKTPRALNVCLSRENMLLAEFAFEDAKIDSSVAIHMVLSKLEQTWALPSVQKALYDLLEDAEVATELLLLALQQTGELEPPDDARKPSNVSKTGPDGSGKLDNSQDGPPSKAGDKPTRATFAEDILPMAMKLGVDIKGQLKKREMEYVLELPGVQRLWREQEATVKRESELHNAVQRQDVELVEQILRVKPDAVLQRVEVRTLDETDNSVSALWHNNYIVPEGPRRSKAKRRCESSDVPDKRGLIRQLLVSTMIEQSPRMDTLLGLLREANEQFGLVCFDMSYYGLPSTSVSELLRSLYGDPSGGSDGPVYDRATHLKFESVLRYADFPSLDNDRGDPNMTKAPVEIFNTLSWLRKWKGVKRILSLKVLDRMHRPHDEWGIALWTRRLGIKKLDWRFLDMAISYLKDSDIKESERLEELHLYSSGKRVAVDHWLGPNGIRTLEHLQTLYIHIIQDWLPPKAIERLRKMIMKGVEHINKERVETGRSALQLRVLKQDWDSTKTTLLEDDGDIAQRTVPHLHGYIKQYSEYFLSLDLSKRRVRPTRIAIIDSGIVDFWPLQGEREGKNSLRARIADGSTFMHHADRMPPWQFASDPHGTQIANVICAIDPHCEIYIAKVTENRRGILPDNVAEAIIWAKSKDVDIISMSFAVPQPAHNKNPLYAERLKRAVAEAENAGIIQFCSHDDEGLNNEKSWPADCGYAKIVAACNKFGRFTDQKPRNYHYQIPGENVYTGAVPQLGSSEFMSGSSVATAIATGISSLILSRHRLRNGADVVLPDGRIAFIEKELDKMSVDVKSDRGLAKSPRYIHLKGFGYFTSNTMEGGKVQYN